MVSHLGLTFMVLRQILNRMKQGFKKQRNFVSSVTLLTVLSPLLMFQYFCCLYCLNMWSYGFFSKVLELIVFVFNCFIQLSFVFTTQCICTAWTMPWQDVRPSVCPSVCHTPALIHVLKVFFTVW